MHPFPIHFLAKPQSRKGLKPGQNPE